MAKKTQPLSVDDFQRVIEVSQSGQGEGDKHQNLTYSLPLPSPPVPDQPSSRTNRKQTRCKKRDCLDVARFIVELFTLGMLFWYTIITNKLWETADQGNKSNVESAHLDQRAWVVVDEISPPGETDEEKHTLSVTDSKTVLMAKFVNVGKSPALNAVVVGISQIQDINAPPPCNKVVFAGDTVSRAVIPNDNWSKPLRSGIVVKDLTQESIQAIETNKKRLFAHGLVEYEDIFRSKRKTTFCQFFVQGDKVASFQNCPCGNDIE